MKSTAIGWNSSIKRTEWGAKRRKSEQHEAKQAVVLEGVTKADGTLIRLGLFDLHKVDWLHCVTPRTDKGSLKAGFPDYLILGKDFLAFLEIKHGKLPGVKGIGSLSQSQRDFHARLHAAKQDVMVAWLPEDLQAVNLWLRGYTGIICDVDGLVA